MIQKKNTEVMFIIYVNKLCNIHLSSSIEKKIVLPLDKMSDKHRKKGVNVIQKEEKKTKKFHFHS